MRRESSAFVSPLGLVFVVFVAVVLCAGPIGCSEESSTRECPALEPVNEPTLADGLAGLDGLAFDELIDRSFEQLFRRSPESLTQIGMSETLGLRDDRLDNASEAFAAETAELEEALLDLLRSYDRDALSPEQRVTRDVYEWFLDDEVRAHEFAHFTYPVTPIITATHRRLLRFLLDVHPIDSRHSAEDYVARLGQVSRKLEQTRQSLIARRDKGVVAPRFLLEVALPGLRAQGNAIPNRSALYTNLEQKMLAVAELSAGERQDLLDAAQTAIACHVSPAFRDLTDTVESLVPDAPTQDGVWQFENGESYYRQALRHHTTTDMSAEEIHQLGLDEIDRIHSDMRERFTSLGYPAGESIVQLFGRLDGDSPLISGSQVQSEYEAMIADAAVRADEAFDIRPQAEVVVVDSGGGAFYISPAPDGSRPGQFFVNLAGARPRYVMPTLAYHEAIPGHHFQIALAQEQGLPPMRAHTRFTSYVEGWALYTEGLAGELGWYESDVPGDLGRLQAEAFRAARLVVDTGIHAKQWTFQQAVDYMVENVAYSRPGMESEVARYISWPGQATAYKSGMLRIQALRQQAMDTLGEAFDLKTFHNVILTSGSVPLEVLDRIVADYIEASTPADL